MDIDTLCIVASNLSALNWRATKDKNLRMTLKKGVVPLAELLLESAPSVFRLIQVIYENQASFFEYFSYSPSHYGYRLYFAPIIRHGPVFYDARCTLGVETQPRLRTWLSAHARMVVSPRV